MFIVSVIEMLINISSLFLSLRTAYCNPITSSNYANYMSHVPPHSSPLPSSYAFTPPDLHTLPTAAHAAAGGWMPYSQFAYPGEKEMSFSVSFSLSPSLSLSHSLSLPPPSLPPSLPLSLPPPSLLPPPPSPYKISMCQVFKCQFFLPISGYLASKRSLQGASN